MDIINKCLLRGLPRVRRGFSEEVLTIGDPNLPMANTIAYEIGFDQSFLESYLIHLSAYYKDISISKITLGLLVQIVKLTILD